MTVDDTCTITDREQQGIHTCSYPSCAQGGEPGNEARGYRCTCIAAPTLYLLSERGVEQVACL